MTVLVAGQDDPPRTVSHDPAARTESAGSRPLFFVPDPQLTSGFTETVYRIACPADWAKSPSAPPRLIRAWMSFSSQGWMQGKSDQMHLAGVPGDSAHQAIILTNSKYEIICWKM